jgi:hypothetical protein
MALARKACPRCSGATFIEDDLFTIDLVCLQCGSRRSLPRPRRFTDTGNPFETAA